MINQRRGKRVRQTNEAVIKFGPGARASFRNRVIVAETYDISMEGARIITDKFFPIGTVVRLQIDLKSSGQVLKIDGAVKWGKKIPDEDHFEFGLEFVHEISRTIVSLIIHLSGENQRIPSTVSAAGCR